MVANEGYKVKRIREILGIKQETLAAELGLNQQKISALEQKQKIDDELMEQIAKALRVPADSIRYFDEQAAVNVVTNSFHDNSKIDNLNFNPTFHPLDKLMETVSKNEILYERLLQSEKEKVQIYENLLKSKSQSS